MTGSASGFILADMNLLHLAFLFAPLALFAVGGIICEHDWFDRLTDRLGFPCSKDEWVS